MSRLGRLFDPELAVSAATFFLIAGVTVGLDQASKWLAVGFLEARAPLVLIPDCLRLDYATNTGAAFSMLAEHTGMLTLLSAAVSAIIVIWAVRLGPAEWGCRIALGLILGGAVGNLIDRAVLGYVIDFISAHWHYKYFWPTFNIADSAVCVGVGMFIITSFRRRDPDSASSGKGKEVVGKRKQ